MRFKKKWLRHFAKGVSQQQLEQHVLGDADFIWHVFSWDLIGRDAYFAGDAARTVFDRADKHGAMYYAPFSPRKRIVRRLPPDTTASGLDALEECYVIAPDWSWTYIKTHEGDACGPYFYEPGANA